MLFSWLATSRLLSPVALTVRAQTVSPNDQGRLRWETYVPRENVNSIDLADISTLDDRPVSDRREWNANGRLIPLVVPAGRTVTMTPIESRDVIDEQEMNRMSAGANGNEAVIQDLIGVSLPKRADRLASANYRRLELDFIQAWTQGTLTSRNPEDASKTDTASFGFASARYEVAPTAWSDGSVNAYSLLLAAIERAVDAVGSVEGVALRLATLKAIQADAPNLPNGVPMTRAELANRIQDDSNQPFRFEIWEDSYDVFVDGGTAKQRQKAWPAGVIGFIPPANKLGNTYFAPVVRAQTLASQLPQANIDVRGNTVFYHEHNGGKELRTDCQLNAIPVPEEQNVFVINTGVS